LYTHFSANSIKSKKDVYWLNRIEKHAYISQIEYPKQKQDIKIGYFELDEGTYMIFGCSLKEDKLFKKQLSLILIISFSVILVIGFIVVFYLINKVMASIESVSDTAIKIEKGDLSQRVEINSNKREIRNLITSFNKMLNRINNLLYEIKEVSNNIAHDLKSPVTSIRVISENALSANSSNTDITSFEKIILKCDYLVSMINTLLEIADIESNVIDYNFTRIDLNYLLNDAYELYSTSAKASNVKLELEIKNDKLEIWGNHSLFQRAISNIVDNAIKYNKENGHVLISADLKIDRVEICIVDSGIGISKNEIKKIFNKFYRVDKSRSIEGNGLGLSFVQSVINKHNGYIYVNSEIKVGTSLILNVPSYR
jgi:signal transduction histidine kinase